MENTIRLSVIVPVYNVEKYILKCLESLKNQTLKEMEVIIVNDGSKDDSVKICYEFIKGNGIENFKIFNKENGGLSDARNYGMQFANGKYICFLDSDDYVDNNTYEILVNAIEKENKKMVQCGYYLTYEKKEKGVHVSEYSSLNDLAAYGLVNAWNKIFDKKFIIENKILFPIGLYYEDIYFFYSVLEKMNTIDEVGTIDKPLIHYVQRKNSIMGDNSNKVSQIIDIYKMLEDNKFKSEIEYRCSRNFHGSFLKKALKIKNKEKRTQLIDEFNNYIKYKYPLWKSNKYYKKGLKDFIILHISEMFY